MSTTDYRPLLFIIAGLLDAVPIICIAIAFLLIFQ